MKALKLFSVISLLTAAFFFACKPSSKEKDVIIYKVKTLKWTYTNADIDSNGVDIGDETSFIGNLVDENGQKGTVLGYNKIIEMPDSNNQLQGQARITRLVFRFGNDEIIVFGAVNYPNGGSEMKAGILQRDAIIGGTGKYIGARGEIVVKRLESGEYENEFRFLK